MDFREPDCVESPRFRRHDLIEAHREGVLIRLIRHLPVKFVIPANFHVCFPLPVPDGIVDAGR